MENKYWRYQNTRNKRFWFKGEGRDHPVIKTLRWSHLVQERE